MILDDILNNRKPGQIYIDEYKLDVDELLEAYRVFILDWLLDGTDVYQQYLCLQL